MRVLCGYPRAQRPSASSCLIHTRYYPSNNECSRCLTKPVRHAGDTEGGQKASFPWFSVRSPSPTHHHTMRALIVITLLTFTATSPAQVVITGEDGVITALGLIGYKSISL